MNFNCKKKKNNYVGKDYNYINSRVNVDIPSKEELEKAEQYENKITNILTNNIKSNFCFILNIISF